MARLEASFRATPRGARYATTWLPDRAPRPTATVLFVPPFAEELNKCRRMLALAGAGLANAGWRACLPDLGGTGDSEGELADARVADWIADVVDAAAAATADGAPVRAIIGVRLGAALAGACLARLAGATTLVLWQPVVSGQQHLAQFLRLKVAGNLVGGGGGGGPPPTVAALRAELGAGKTLEVAGYAIAPGLAADLDALRFTPPPASDLPDLHWLELSASDPPVPGPLATDHVQRWRDAGGRATAGACAGDPFWSTVEVTTAPALLAATLAACGAPPP